MMVFYFCVQFVVVNEEAVAIGFASVRLRRANRTIDAFGVDVKPLM